MTDFKHTFADDVTEGFHDPISGKEIWRPSLAYPFFVGFGLKKPKCGCGRIFKNLEDYHAHYIYKAVWKNESGYLNRVAAGKA